MAFQLCLQQAKLVCARSLEQLHVQMATRVTVATTCIIGILAESAASHHTVPDTASAPLVTTRQDHLAVGGVNSRCGIIEPLVDHHGRVRWPSSSLSWSALKAVLPPGSVPPLLPPFRACTSAS